MSLEITKCFIRCLLGLNAALAFVEWQAADAEAILTLEPSRSKRHDHDDDDGAPKEMHNHVEKAVKFEDWHHHGTFTFTDDIGRETCGQKVDFKKDWVVSVGPMYWTASNEKNDPLCNNHCIVLETKKRKQVMLMVHDKCDRCGSKHINLSKIAFDKLGEDESEGHVHGAKWKFVRCDERADKMSDELKAQYRGGGIALGGATLPDNKGAKPANQPPPPTPPTPPPPTPPPPQAPAKPECVNVEVKCSAAYVLEFAFDNCSEPGSPAQNMAIPVGQTRSIKVPKGSKLKFKKALFSSIDVHTFEKDTKVTCKGTLFKAHCDFA